MLLDTKSSFIVGFNTNGLFFSIFCHDFIFKSEVKDVAVTTYTFVFCHLISIFLI